MDNDRYLQRRADKSALPNQSSYSPHHYIIWSPQGGAPTVSWSRRKMAEAEAQRLAVLHPDKAFIVFKATLVHRGAEMRGENV